MICLSMMAFFLVFQQVEVTDPRLRLADEQKAANRLVNGNLARHDGDSFTGWRPWRRGYQVAEGQGRADSASAACSDEGQQGLWQRLDLRQGRPLPVTIRGWSKAVNVSGGRDSGYSLYVDLTYQDGEELWGQNAPFNTGSHDWEQQTLTILPTKPIQSMNVYALFRGHTGQVWFDELEAHELGGGEMVVFDGLPIEIADTAASGDDAPGYQTKHGLAMQYDWSSGTVAGLAVDGRRLHKSTSPSGFLVRDVAANSGYHGFENGRCASLGLTLDAQIQAQPDHLRISGSVTDTTGADRAVTLVFALPIDAVGWEWYDDVRQHRTIEALQEYTNVVNIGTGATGAMSLYPWAAIGDASTALAMGLDMSTPGQFRIGYNAGTRQFFIAYDFGLSPETERFPASAPFAFVIYRCDPQWGFRSASKRFYEIFPEHFVCRSKDQGIWMPFTDVSTVDGWEDFGFKYHEGINNIPFDDSAGILSFRYTEPSTWWMRMPADVPRTHEGVMESLETSLESDHANTRRSARALQVSGTHDSQERLQYLIRNTPWCDGAVFSLNPSPHLPEDSEAQMAWNEATKQRLYGPKAEGIQDGEYLDSLEGYVTANENFRVEHFRDLTVPLTFSTASKRPVIHKAFSVYEFTRWIAEDLHQMGKLLFANSVPHRFAFLCPWIDVMGTEMDWVHNGEWEPASDAWMNFKRGMCYQKPYLFLMNTHYDAFTPDLVEKYFQRSLFYGMYPSMFSHNASQDPYWRAPKWYNRDRHLFKRYMPLIRRIAEAGWEPITHAVSSNQAVFLERFGPGVEGDIYLTVMNTSEETQETAIEVAAQGIADLPIASVVELIGQQPLSVDADNMGLTIRLRLQPEEVLLLRMGR